MLSIVQATDETERNIPGRTYWPFFTMTKTVSMRWD